MINFVIKLFLVKVFANRLCTLRDNTIINYKVMHTFILQRQLCDKALMNWGQRQARVCDDPWVSQ